MDAKRSDVLKISARIAFLHPDLGIGGAERLVVDAGLALKQKGHDVQFFTSHHDPSHCFTETRDGTLPVTVVGDWLPRSIFGRFYALCAYLRMIYAAVYLVFFSRFQPHIIFCDQISACIPVLNFGKWFSVIRVFFYCHFPDQLLSSPGGTLKQLYRAPLNWLEETTTGQADVIYVNSEFTASVFRETFSKLHRKPSVLYPPLNTDNFDKTPSSKLEDIMPHKKLPEFKFLSINRYERKKNLPLAIYALRDLRTLLSTDEWTKVCLIMAGGYDKRVIENVEHFEELRHLIEELNLDDKVFLLRSPSDDEKLALLQSCDCLIYTPANEHFGIVPLEAMYMQKPVIAVKSGGPMETVADHVTGFLCDPESDLFSLAMCKCFKNIGDNEQMGKAGKCHVEKKFSFKSFADSLNKMVYMKMVTSNKNISDLLK